MSRKAGLAHDHPRRSMNNDPRNLTQRLRDRELVDSRVPFFGHMNPQFVEAMRSEGLPLTFLDRELFPQQQPFLNFPTQESKDDRLSWALNDRVRYSDWIEHRDRNGRSAAGLEEGDPMEERRLVWAGIRNDAARQLRHREVDEETKEAIREDQAIWPRLGMEQQITLAFDDAKERDKEERKAKEAERRPKVQVEAAPRKRTLLEMMQDDPAELERLLGRGSSNSMNSVPWPSQRPRTE